MEVALRSDVCAGQTHNYVVHLIYTRLPDDHAVGMLQQAFKREAGCQREMLRRTEQTLAAPACSVVEGVNQGEKMCLQRDQVCACLQDGSNARPQLSVLPVPQGRAAGCAGGSCRGIDLGTLLQPAVGAAAHVMFPTE